MHRNNFGLKRRSKQNPNIAVQDFHSGFSRQCKMHSGYVFWHDNPSHKYGTFKKKFRYSIEQGPLPIFVIIDKTWDENGKKVI